MDRRFQSVERRLDRIERTMTTKRDLEQIREDLRRHFDITAESLRDDLRIFAEATGVQTERLNRHETRITLLERRSI